MTTETHLSEVELFALMQRTIVELMAAGGTDAATAAWWLLTEENPTIAADFGEKRVLAVAETVLRSEATHASRRYQTLFNHLNAEYFASRLPVYTVRVVYDIHYWRPHEDDDRLPPKSHEIDFGKRLILLRLWPNEELMKSLLLDGMAHASTGSTVDSTDSRWISEMIRLWTLDAPVSLDPVLTAPRCWDAIMHWYRARPGFGLDPVDVVAHAPTGRLSKVQKAWLRSLRLLQPDDSQEMADRVAAIIRDHLRLNQPASWFRECPRRVM